MKVYSDTLTQGDLRAALPRGCDLEAVTIRTPRKRAHGWIVRLEAISGNRWRNSGTYGAESVKAATWDQHGEWMARLFEQDPDAVIGYYEGADDFHAKTEGKYAQVTA